MCIMCKPDNRPSKKLCKERFSKEGGEELNVFIPRPALVRKKEFLKGAGLPLVPRCNSPERALPQAGPSLLENLSFDVLSRI